MLTTKITKNLKSGDILITNQCLDVVLFTFRDSEFLEKIVQIRLLTKNMTVIELGYHETHLWNVLI